MICVEMGNLLEEIYGNKNESDLLVLIRENNMEAAYYLITVKYLPMIKKKIDRSRYVLEVNEVASSFFCHICGVNRPDNKLLENFRKIQKAESLPAWIRNCFDHFWNVYIEDNGRGKKVVDILEENKVSTSATEKAGQDWLFIRMLEVANELASPLDRYIVFTYIIYVLSGYETSRFSLDVSTQLHLAPNTVSVRKKRAFEKIKKQLDQ